MCYQSLECIYIGFRRNIGECTPLVCNLRAMSIYESRSKLPFTSFSLGGSCCAKISEIDRGRPKTIGLFHLSEG